jgi:hypothetical protein
MVTNDGKRKRSKLSQHYLQINGREREKRTVEESIH